MTLAVVVRTIIRVPCPTDQTNLRPFGRAAGRLFNAVGDPDPAQFAGAFRIRPAIREPA